MSASRGRGLAGLSPSCLPKKAVSKESELSSGWKAGRTRAPAHARWAEWAVTTERGDGIEIHQESPFHPRAVEQEDTVTHSMLGPVLRASHIFTLSVLPA